ncbi:MAG: hypothetical protein ACLR6J_12295 [Parabacteroides merdae]
MLSALPITRPFIPRLFRRTCGWRPTLTRYPGSAESSSYESEVIVRCGRGEDREERIFMNNVLDVKGYRFFQASYDRDEHGTIPLSVNRDVAGAEHHLHRISAALVIGLILCLVGKGIPALCVRAAAFEKDCARRPT